MSIQRLSNAGQSGYRYKTLIAGITPVPSVPVIGEATAVTFSTASVAFTAPGAYAGSTYTATSSPGGFTGTSASSPITVSGLSGETSYTFTVTATNATGTSGPSAASNSITTPSAWSPESGYDALATVTVPSGGVASVTFAGIPTGYKHLQIRGIARSDRATSGSYIKIQFNGDTANNYANHGLFGTGSSAGAYAVTTTDHAGEAYITAASDTASTFGASVWDVLDYANVSKNKTVRALTGADVNGVNGQFRFASGVWMSTSGITSVTLVDGNGANFVANTQFALYGVK